MLRQVLPREHAFVHHERVSPASEHSCGDRHEADRQGCQPGLLAGRVPGARWDARACFLTASSVAVDS